jgi:hypothetical protein
MVHNTPPRFYFVKLLEVQYNTRQTPGKRSRRQNEIRKRTVVAEHEHEDLVGQKKKCNGVRRNRPRRVITKRMSGTNNLNSGTVSRKTRREEVAK